MVTLLAQINYIVDVAANMLADTHTTASGVFRLAWRGKQHSTTIWFACGLSTCTSPSQWPHACAARLMPHSRRPWPPWSSTRQRQRPRRLTSSMPAGSFSVPSACRRPLLSGTSPDFASGRASWPHVPIAESVRSSYSMHKSRSCAALSVQVPCGSLSTLPCWSLDCRLRHTCNTCSSSRLTFGSAPSP